MSNQSLALTLNRLHTLRRTPYCSTHHCMFIELYSIVWIVWKVQILQGGNIALLLFVSSCSCMYGPKRITYDRGHIGSTNLCDFHVHFCRSCMDTRGRKRTSSPCSIWKSIHQVCDCSILNRSLIVFALNISQTSRRPPHCATTHCMFLEVHIIVWIDWLVQRGNIVLLLNSLRVPCTVFMDVHKQQGEAISSTNRCAFLLGTSAMYVH
jgi:hypothetical protein